MSHRALCKCAAQGRGAVVWLCARLMGLFDSESGESRSDWDCFGPHSQSQSEISSQSLSDSDFSPISRWVRISGYEADDEAGLSQTKAVSDFLGLESHVVSDDDDCHDVASGEEDCHDDDCHDDDCHDVEDTHNAVSALPVSALGAIATWHVVCIGTTATIVRGLADSMAEPSLPQPEPDPLSESVCDVVHVSGGHARGEPPLPPPPFIPLGARPVIEPSYDPPWVVRTPWVPPESPRVGVPFFMEDASRTPWVPPPQGRCLRASASSTTSLYSLAGQRLPPVPQLVAGGPNGGRPPTPPPPVMPSNWPLVPPPPPPRGWQHDMFGFPRCPQEASHLHLNSGRSRPASAEEIIGATQLLAVEFSRSLEARRQP